MYNRKETIAAICTPPGEGGVAIIRICGPTAVEVADSLFSGPVSSFKSHTVHYGKVSVDHVLLVPMLNGKSYTGDETVEIHCHGGMLISKRVLEAVFATGARAALPGEFTFRAYMNGKLDLAQAEAVQEVISAKSERAVDIAADQLKGRLSSKIRAFQSELTNIAAILEAWVDFPEEGLEFATLEEICNDLSNAVANMQQLQATFHEGRRLKEGISLCLVGPPNVGKSSLMNALVDRDRSIVTHIPGTTRDIVEDEINLSGFNIRLVDTAGIRETTELVEQEGIRRSIEAMECSDLILLVCDASNKTHPLLETDSKKTLVVWNKIDLVDEYPREPLINSLGSDRASSRAEQTHGVGGGEGVRDGSRRVNQRFPRGIGVSAKSGEGMDMLKRSIEKHISDTGTAASDQVIITNLRHKEALSSAIESCQKTIEGLKTNVSPEFLCLDLRQALVSLGCVIGTDVTEDVLGAIFSKFCVGK